MDTELKVLTYYCDSCPAYCEIKKENNLPPRDVCIETDEKFNSKKKGWYLICQE